MISHVLLTVFIHSTCYIIICFTLFIHYIEDILAVNKMTQFYMKWIILLCMWTCGFCQNSTCKFVCFLWFKYNLGQEYPAPQVQPDRGSNSSSPDHGITFYVTQTLALTTRPSVTFQMYRLSDKLMHWQLIFLVQVQLRTEVPRTPSSTRRRFKLMTSRSWQYILCH